MVLAQVRRAAAGQYNSQKAVFQCTTCGACEFQCRSASEHVPIMVGLRRGAVNTGTWEDELRRQALQPARTRDQRVGIGTLERDKFIQKQAFPIFDGTQEYCLWLGCMGGYDPKAARSSRLLLASCSTWAQATAC